MKAKTDKTNSAVQNSKANNGIGDTGFFAAQAKLEVGEPDYQHKQESHRGGERVVAGQSETSSFFTPVQSTTIQSKSISQTISGFVQKQEEEEEVQAEIDIQRQAEEEEEAVQTQPMEEEEVQTKLAIQFQGGEEEELIQPKTEKVTQQVHHIAKKGFFGSSGSYPFFNKIQTSFGSHDISNIQAFNDSYARSSNLRMGSLAYTSGNKVAFQKAPNLHTAAHEAAHVVQQQNGVNLKSGIGQRNDAYEKHADAVADRVVQGKGAADLLAKIPISENHSSNSVLQFAGLSSGLALGAYWDMYINPGNHPGVDQGFRDVGRQVRSFQRLKNRSSHNEAGQRIIDVNDRRVTAGQTLNDSEQINQPGATGPRTWNITLTTHELFDSQPELADVQQGGIGDCYLLATLQSMSSTGGGRTMLTNIVSESANGYSVEFYRLQVIGNQALVDSNSRIRVGIGRGYNPQGVRLREKAGTMTSADARQLVLNSEHGPQVQAGDTFNVNWTKRIVWPWAIERAYASVAGGYNRIEGGFASLPMMVLTGRIPHRIYNFGAFSDADIAAALTYINTLTDDDSTVTSATYNNLQNIYSRTFLVEAADRRRGIRLKGVDGVITSWIPWDEIINYISTFIILDPLGPFNGRSAITTNSDYPNYRDALVNAMARTGVFITGSLATVCLGQGLVLAPGHAYSITSLSAAGAQTYNPWASLHPGLVSPNQLKRAFSRIIINP